ncbi:hypothetical protein [Xylophilus sp.]|uniref:hypothetical protein n=1 Tax=Xylophilus sp. TaxID=2653893 RepID=UPI002D7E4A19|nr:hypothetical protein [Xylophilus sp.]
MPPSICFLLSHSQSEVHLTQSKIHVADGTVRPRRFRFARRFPSATLIRLYEFLKNSRLIDLSRSTTKQPLAKAALVLSRVAVVKLGGG